MGMPSDCPSPATMSAPHAPGGLSSPREIGSATATTRSAPTACAAAASAAMSSTTPKKFGLCTTRQATRSVSSCAAWSRSVAPAGATDLDQATRLLTDRVACLVVQSPNFFGVVEDMAALAAAAHAVGALLVVAVAEPISLGLLKPPGACGADIVAGEGQSLGIPMSYGGPYLGFFATLEKYIRQLPGRVVGATTDREGRTGYVLTLATREQHIRREKATSNICTSQALIALMGTIYMETLGRQGLREVALQNLQKAAYTKERLVKVKGCGLRFAGPTFNEFVLQVTRKPADLLKGLLRKQIIGGLDLGRFYPELADCLLVCVTEQNSREQIDALIAAMGGGR